MQNGKTNLRLYSWPKREVSPQKTIGKKDNNLKYIIFVHFGKESSFSTFNEVLFCYWYSISHYIQTLSYRCSHSFSKKNVNSLSVMTFLSNCSFCLLKRKRYRIIDGYSFMYCKKKPNQTNQEHFINSSLGWCLF